MKTLVVKFGGTSVADEAKRKCAIERIREAKNAGFGVVAVVSAMGRKGAPYATDTLLSLVEQGESAPRTRDLLMSCGETISACVFSHALCLEGIPSAPMNAYSAGIKANGSYNCAEITGMDAANVKNALEQGMVPVITGFQGVDENNDVNTLGRGGSDTSAVEIGGYLGAEGVIIYTDVPGIAQTDPRIISEAKYAEEMDSDDVLLLAQNGAGVIHPRAVRAAMGFDIPVWVRSTFTTGSGTLIKHLEKKQSGLVGIALKKGEVEAVITLIARPMGGDLLQSIKNVAANAAVEGDIVTVTLPLDEANGAIRKIYDLFA